MRSIEKEYDLVICGGGMAGFCAGIAAARNGLATCLIQDRPVLGGNASSEVRVTVHGAACHHPGARETGVLGEAMQAERRSNHLYPIENGWTNSVHDMALYDMAIREPTLSCQLNTSLVDVQLEDGSWGLSQLSRWPVPEASRGYLLRPACHGGMKLKAVRCRVANAETELLISGKYFLDATGDALLAHLAGCEWRMGSESREETSEVHAVAKASRDTMGNSIHFRCIDTGQPAPFKAPSWAMQYEDADFFYKQGRAPREPEGGYWWIEIGVPWDTIHDNETIRHELTRHALGVWDWMKNRDPKMIDRCRNYALEFIGQVPGKRESRRVMGLHFLNENELQARRPFPDECAYGGWFIDLHTPGGLLAPTSEPDSALGYDTSLKEVALKLIGPYGIPARSLVSRDVANLMMAGRNISVTHAALGTVRVMATCGLMGEAAATVATVADVTGKSLAEVVRTEMEQVQQRLLRQGCFLPNARNQDPADLALRAQVEASSTWGFSGLGIWDQVEDRNLRKKIWECARGRTVCLNREPCQWFFLDGGSLDSLSVAVFNSSGSEALILTAALRRVESIWSYDKENGRELWRGQVSVPAAWDGFLELPLALHDLEKGCYRLELSGPQELSWRCSSGRAHGVFGGHVVGSGRYHWNRLHGEFAFQLHPPQRCFAPAEVISGVNRPASRPNFWLSDPGLSLPQSLQLTWDSPQSFSRIELTFPAQLVLETHWENPFYVPPHVATRYRIEAGLEGGWQVLVRVDGNDRTRRFHELESPIATTCLRLVVEETHGGGSAGLTEIRCY